MKSSTCDFLIWIRNLQGNLMENSWEPWRTASEKKLFTGIFSNWQDVRTKSGNLANQEMSMKKPQCATGQTNDSNDTCRDRAGCLIVWAKTCVKPTFIK